MIDLTKRDNLDLSTPFDFTVEYVNKQLSEQTDFKYVQFFSYKNISTKRNIIDSVVLWGRMKSENVWKLRIEETHDNVEWLNDTYDYCLKAFEILSINL